jgi:hypothetical protein
MTFLLLVTVLRWPAAAAPKSGKDTKATAKGDKKKRKGKRQESYAICIY